MRKTCFALVLSLAGCSGTDETAPSTPSPDGGQNPDASTPAPSTLSDGGNDPSASDATGHDDAPVGHVDSGGPAPKCDPNAPIPPSSTNAPTGQWKNVTANLTGASSACGNMELVYAKPDEDMVIAGVAESGLWKSTDGGGSWQLMGTGQGSEKLLVSSEAILFDPDSPKTFWTAGIRGNPVIAVTKDDGDTFTSLSGSQKGIFGNGPDNVAVDFTDPARKTIVVGGHEMANAVFRSQDGGKTWVNVGQSLPSNHTQQIIVVDADTFLVAVNGWLGSDRGIYRTTNAGTSWTEVSTAAVGNPPLTACDGTLYWAVTGGGLVRSTDHGQTWRAVGGGKVKFSPIELPDRRLVGLGDSLMISSDRGDTWQPVSAKLPEMGAAVGQGWWMVTYSTFQKAFFIVHADCGDAVLPDAIQRFDFDYKAQ